MPNDNIVWKEKLSPEAYHVTREGGTERAFSHPLHDEKRDGTYFCTCCGTQLFTSTYKYNSGSGWPSFYDIEDHEAILAIEDNRHGMRRVEVKCRACDAHLGHVFDDGPLPTGMRYCINGTALSFEAEHD